MTPRIRPITPADAVVLARLHAESWRSAYRGLFSDTFLDHEVHAERLQVWTERTTPLAPADLGFIAEIDHRPAGFIFVRAAHDPTWGTMVDNLHVANGLRSQGLGRQLLATAMRELLSRGHRQPVWLWVFEQNDAARRVYARLGGRETERAVDRSFDGAERAKWRVVWQSPEALREACGVSASTMETNPS